MLFQRTLMLFTAEEVHNFFTMHLEPQVFACTNVFGGSTLWSCRKAELRIRINFSPIHRWITLLPSEGKSAIAKALNKQCIRLGDKCVIVTKVKKLD
jgi:hypothetical protein